MYSNVFPFTIQLLDYMLLMLEYTNLSLLPLFVRALMISVSTSRANQSNTTKIHVMFKDLLCHKQFNFIFLCEETALSYFTINNN